VESGQLPIGVLAVFQKKMSLVKPPEDSIDRIPFLIFGHVFCGSHHLAEEVNESKLKRVFFCCCSGKIRYYFACLALLMRSSFLRVSSSIIMAVWSINFNF
jgi:hypothetical protein